MESNLRGKTYILANGVRPQGIFWLVVWHGKAAQ